MRRSLLVYVLAAGCAATPPAATHVAPAAPPMRPAAVPAFARAEAAPPAAPMPALVAARAELGRTMAALEGAPEPPYYVAYTVTERATVSVSASLGAIVSSDEDRQRTLDVDLRVGTPELDNTRPLRGERHGSMSGADSTSSALPLDDDERAIRAAIWLATDRRLKAAREQLLKVKANHAVKVQQEDTSDDFSREEPVTSVAPQVGLAVDSAAWEDRVRAWSRVFRAHPRIHFSQVQLQAQAVNRGFVNSEGTTVQSGRNLVQVRVYASTTADDGMDLARYESIDAPTLAELPDDAVVRARIDRVIGDLEALRVAPVATPYVGPAVLEGRAAGVFFHEVFGHRVEGHRQKDEAEGQTFTRMLGKPIMPAFIDVFDDPTLARLGDVHLNGAYRQDDEGVLAARASLVEAGVFRGFLMSRSPVQGFPRSNGHGRRQEGYPVVARQGNLVVSPRRAVSPAELKQLLLTEVERAGLPFGLRFTVVEGGYTTTRRDGAQSFKVLPVMVYRVFPDGREQLVRGADLEGTPLSALARILAAADDYVVFNGFCGAESGYVPVSAVSPSLLFGQVEIARKSKGQDKPPILPAPPLSPGEPAPTPALQGAAQ